MILEIEFVAEAIFGRGKMLRFTVAWMLMLFYLSLPVFCQNQQGDTSSPHNLGQARISVYSDLNSAEDDISIRVLNNTDQKVLSDILDRIAYNFRRMPSNVSYVQGDSEFPEDTSAAIRFYMPIVPRQGGELPTDEFVMAVAGHASRMRIVYAIAGNSDFRMANRFSRDDVDFKASEPFINPKSAIGKLAVYDADVIIKSPAVADGPVAAKRKRTHNRIALAIAIAIMIIALGIIISQLIPRRHEEADSVEVKDDEKPSSGEKND